MKALEIIHKTREYLDYIEMHINNVYRAWEEVKYATKSFPISYDDFRYFKLLEEVMNHDMSKLSSEEFVQYRRCLYPTESERKENPDIPLVELSKAWEHHKKENPHHWENWSAEDKIVSSPYDLEIHCTHMVIDWLAISYQVGDTPRSFYENNKEKIKLPKWAEKYIMELFDAIELNRQKNSKI